MDASASTVTEEGALCASWLSQPAPATLQPLAPWPPYTEYVSHEAVSCPYSADMYVQPVCPSYTVVGPSSVLTYASQPLITNVTVCHTEAQMHHSMPRAPRGFRTPWPSLLWIPRVIRSLKHTLSSRRPALIPTDPVCLPQRRLRLPWSGLTSLRVRQPPTSLFQSITIAPQQ